MREASATVRDSVRRGFLNANAGVTRENKKKCEGGQSAADAGEGGRKEREGGRGREKYHVHGKGTHVDVD